MTDAHGSAASRTRAGAGLVRLVVRAQVAAGADLLAVTTRARPRTAAAPVVR